MKFAQGPRPWTIWLYAGITTAFLIYVLSVDLQDLVVAQVRYGWVAPSFDWDDDSLIVLASAGFTIKMIPVILIWAFAVRIARWLVLAMAVIPLPFDLLKTANHVAWLGSEGYDDLVTSHLIGVGTGFAIQFGLIALLFLPPSNRWFARKQEISAHAFE